MKINTQRTDYRRGFYGTQEETIIDSAYRLVEVHMADWSRNESWECQEWYIEANDGNTIGPRDKYGDSIPVAKCSDTAGWDIELSMDKLIDMLPDLPDASANKILDSISYRCDTDMPMAARFAEQPPASPDSKGECLIVCTKNYFAADCQATAKNRPRPITDDNGDELIFANYTAAKSYLDKLASEVYVCDNGEAGRPYYKITATEA